MNGSRSQVQSTAPVPVPSPIGTPPAATAAPLTPSDLAYAASELLTLSSVVPGPLLVTGAYARREGKQSYNGYYYDSLRDLASTNSLTLRVPELLRASLQDGRAYVLRGSLVRRVSDGELRIDLTFQVSGVDCELSAPARTRDAVERADLFHLKTRSGFRAVEQVLRARITAGGTPVIILIHGKDAVVPRDVAASLKTAAACYDLRQRQVTLRDPAAITNLLGELDRLGADALGIIRGGGDLDAFDDLRLARAIVELKTPFVCALGHAADRTLVDQLADLSLPTPTALGEFLRRVAEQGRAGREQSRTAEQVRAEFDRREQQLAQRATQVSDEADDMALERQRLAAEAARLQSFSDDLDAREREADRTLAPAASSAPAISSDQTPSPAPARRSTRIVLTIIFALALGILLGAGIAFLIVALSSTTPSSAAPPVSTGLSPLPPTPTPSASPHPTIRPRRRDAGRRPSASAAPRVRSASRESAASIAAPTGDTSSSTLEPRP